MTCKYCDTPAGTKWKFPAGQMMGCGNCRHKETQKAMIVAYQREVEYGHHKFDMEVNYKCPKCGNIDNTLWIPCENVILLPKGQIYEHRKSI